MAALQQQNRKLASAARLAAQASVEHSAAGSRVDLAYDYLLLTRMYVELGSKDEARSSAAKLSGLLSQLPDADRSVLTKALEGLRVRLEPD
jgi:hypothetical protein